MASVPACTFCVRMAHDSYALTHRNSDWGRVVAPVCGRCWTLLRRAGVRGRRLKATRQRWYLGHGQGQYGAPQEHY